MSEAADPRLRTRAPVLGADGCREGVLCVYQGSHHLLKGEARRNLGGPGQVAEKAALLELIKAERDLGEGVHGARSETVTSDVHVTSIVSCRISATDGRARIPSSRVDHPRWTEEAHA